MASKNIIINRHPLVVRWLEDKGIAGSLVENLSFPEALNNNIYGPTPFSLAAVAESVSLVRLPRLPAADHRRYLDSSMTIEEMDAFGAHLRTYKVTKIGGPSF